LKYSFANLTSDGNLYNGTESSETLTTLAEDNLLSAGDIGDGYLFGTPETDAQYWQQQDTDYTCAVVAQISIYESLTGEYISEDIAATYAENQGWLSTTGTYLVDSDNILNELEVETQQYQNGNIDLIIEALNQGDKLIAGVDANEIWNPASGEQTDAGHAVWITGVELNPDNTFDFILNDSGTSDGQGEIVAGADFMNAWNDYDNFLIVVDAQSI
jgi:hypothetical protein